MSMGRAIRYGGVDRSIIRLYIYLYIRYKTVVPIVYSELES